VIVGFYENDLAGNDPAPAPTALTRLRSSVQRTMQQYLYSYEFYRRVALTLRYRLTTGESDRQRLAELDGEGVLLGEGRSTDPSDRPLNELDYFDDEQVKGLVCSDQPSRSGRQDSLAARLQEPSGEIARWRQTVRALQQLNRDGRYRLMFFVNMAPPACPTDDRFTAGGSLDDDAALAKVLGDGTPVVSSTAEFLHYRPSQMPGAGGHSLGNANRVKAEVLFRYLRGEVLPGLLSNSSAH
jgi:hypothetical protein